MKNPGSFFNLKHPMLAHCSDDLYKQALEYLVATGDTDGFCVMLQGA